MINKAKGFTLIELLVVIAIIAILVAILMPVFARAREKARTNSCLSNLRQISKGVRMYIDDYDETFPYWMDFNGGTWDASTHWYFRMQPYIRSADIWLCPSRPEPPYQSYGCRTHYTPNGTSWLFVIPFEGDYYAGLGGPWIRKLSGIKHPTKTVMMHCSIDGSGTGGVVSGLGTGTRPG